MNKQQDFPSIHFESSLYFGEIANISDLKKLFQLYEGTLTRIEVLRARNKVIEGIGEDSASWGFKSDNVGSVTLGEFLKQHNVEV